MKKTSFLTGLLLGIIVCLAVVLIIGYILFSRMLKENNTQQPAQQTSTAAPQAATPQTPASLLETLNKIIAMRPTEPAAYINKANLLNELGAYEEAIENYDIAISLDPSNAQTYLSRSIARFMMGDFNGAARDLTSAININPALAQAYYNRGVTGVNLNKFERATQDFTKAKDLFLQAKDMSGYADADKAVKILKDYTSALAAAGGGKKPSAKGAAGRKISAAQEAALKQNPKELVSIKRDDTSIERNKTSLTASLSGSGGLLEKFNQNAAVNRQGAMPGLGDMDSYESAVRKTMAEGATKAKDQPKNILDYRGDSQKKMAAGDFKGAISDLDKAIELNPKDENLYTERALAHAQQRNSAGAISDLTKALEINPKNPSAFAQRAQQRALTGDNKGALEDAQTAQELYKAQGNKQGYQQAADMANTIQGKEVKTQETDTIAQRLQKEGATAYAKGDYATAAAKFKELADRQPDIPEIHYNLGISEAARGNYAESEKAFKMGIAKGGGNMPDIYSGLATSQLQQEKYDEARKNAQQALKLNPESVSAYKTLAMADAKQGDMPAAIEKATAAINLDKTDPGSYDDRGVFYAQSSDLQNFKPELIPEYKENFTKALADFTRAEALAKEKGDDAMAAKLTEKVESVKKILEQLNQATAQPPAK